MTFSRRILNHGPNPTGTPHLLSLSAVKSCWFDLHRQGGCGSGQIVLSDDFQNRDSVQVGDWISFEAEAEERWYLGRVEERRAEVPAGIRIRLEGMSVELNRMFPGGFGEQADGQRPHLYAATDLFQDDPDYPVQTYDSVHSAEELVRLLISQSLPPGTHLLVNPDRIEAPLHPAPVTSFKVRGEESVRALIKDLAVRSQGAAWGVDEQGEFFFLRPRSDVLVTFQEQQDLTAFSESQDLEFVFNRILMTGDYIYDRFEGSDEIARRSYRWRANFFEPISRGEHGDRRIRIWLPWVRTQSDGLTFARQFFRTYSQPVKRYFLETVAKSTLPRPWFGQVRVTNRDGETLIVARPEVVRVLFDHVPRFRMELGPADPRELWPEPPQDERWEIPPQRLSNGGDVSMTSFSSEGDGGDDNGGGGGESSYDSDFVSLSQDHSIDDSLSDASDGSDGSEPGEVTSSDVLSSWDSEMESGTTVGASDSERSGREDSLTDSADFSVDDSFNSTDELESSFLSSVDLSSFEEIDSSLTDAESNSTPDSSSFADEPSDNGVSSSAGDDRASGGDDEDNSSGNSPSDEPYSSSEEEGTTFVWEH